MDSLSDAFEAATYPQERELLTQALGNTGSDAAMKAAEQMLASEDPRQRASGVMALRLLAGEAAEARIAAVARQDPDANVRAQAIGAFRSRDPSEI